MKKSHLLLLLAASASFCLTSCEQAPDAEKDPNADAAYKRSHRTEQYREAQRSNVSNN
jgi:starvation-inducible outer membrane lipoprotein